MKLYGPLWLLAWVIGFVSAYDLYGGYERIIYYNAYRMDWAKSGGDESRMTIASGCRKGKDKKDPCDILDFVEFVNADGKKPVLNMKNAPANWDPANMKAEHADWTAKALRDSGSTGIYLPNKIYQGVGRADVDGLFRKVGLFIAGARYADGIPQDAFKGAQHSINAWADLRKFAQQLAFKEHLEKTYLGKDEKLPDLEKEYGSSGDKVKTFNPRESMAQLRKLPNMAKYTFTDDFAKFQADDPGHNEKVILADTAKQQVADDKPSCGG